MPEASPGSIVALKAEAELGGVLADFARTGGVPVANALMAGFVAIAAGAIMPGVASSISKIFSKVASVMTGSASQGS